MVRTPPPRKITSYIGFYRNKDLHPPNPPPPPKKKKNNNNKKLHPPPPPINVSTILNRKKYSCKKNPTKNTLIRVFFFCYLSLDAPGPCFYLRGEGGGGGGTIIFSFIRGLAPFWGSKILNFNTFEGFQKNEYFLGYEDFVDIFWGHHKTPKS